MKTEENEEQSPFARYLHLAIEGHINTIFTLLLCKLPNINMLTAHSFSLSQKTTIRIPPSWGGSPELRNKHPRRQRHPCVIPQNQASVEKHIRIGLQLSAQAAFVYRWLPSQPCHCQQGPIPAALRNRIKERIGCAAPSSQAPHVEGWRLWRSPSQKPSGTC